MWNALIRKMTELVYFVAAKRRQFRNNHPDTPILLSAATKARQLDEDSEISRGTGWMFAKRATLVLTDRAIHCGEWRIPLETIDSARLVRYPGLFSTGLVLKVSTADGAHYQFGMQYDPAWEEQTALDLTVEEAELGHTAYSVAVRLLLVATLVWYLLW